MKIEISGAPEALGRAPRAARGPGTGLCSLRRDSIVDTGHSRVGFFFKFSSLSFCIFFLECKHRPEVLLLLLTRLFLQSLQQCLVPSRIQQYVLNGWMRLAHLEGQLPVLKSYIPTSQTSPGDPKPSREMFFLLFSLFKICPYYMNLCGLRVNTNKHTGRERAST